MKKRNITHTKQDGKFMSVQIKQLVSDHKKLRKMYYILVYDIADVKRLPRILKICRKYLYWVQKSVFEGEMTKSQFLSIKAELLSKINKKEDSVIFYVIRNKEVIRKKILGVEKNEITNFI